MVVESDSAVPKQLRGQWVQDGGNNSPSSNPPLVCRLLLKPLGTGLGCNGSFGLVGWLEVELGGANQQAGLDASYQVSRGNDALLHKRASWVPTPKSGTSGMTCRL